MGSDDGFDAFGEEIKSDPLGVLLAKWRRDAFTRKLKKLPDVIEVIPSGSLARGTHIGPVHDIDLIVVFDKSAHPDYGSGPESARAAMTYLENKLLEQLHPLSGTEALIKGTEQRTHVVNCHGVSAGPYAEFIPSPPPVDVMPAVREKPSLLERSHLLVPELPAGGGGGWTDVDPETFMRQVEQRQREWKYFTEVIQMVRAWAELNQLDMKTVAIEAMVLAYCPRPRLFETLSRGEAIARFFEAASKARITSLKDPAGRCGEIDPGMDFGELQRKLTVAAGLARQAMNAEYKWKNRYQLMQDATDPSVFWRKLFGKEYPEAREPYWRAPAWEPWFGKYQAEYAAAPDLGDPAPKPPPGHGPKPPPPDGPDGPDDLGPDGPDDLGPNGPDDLGPNGPDDLDPRGSVRRPGARPAGHSASGPGRRTGPVSAEPGTGPSEEASRPDGAPRTAPSPSRGDGPPDGGSGSGGLAPPGPARRRYLKGQCPQSIPVGKPFSLLVSIVLDGGPDRAELKPFGVPAEGRDVLLVAYAPELRLLGDQRMTVHVPAEGNSDPVMFELSAEGPGPRRVSITAWIGGSYLGELLVEITAEHGRPPGLHREVLAEIAAEHAEGAVSLVVRYDPNQNAYRFEFLDEDNPGEVLSNLVYEPGPRVESLIDELDQLAKGRIDYSPEQAKFHLRQAGARLWSELVPVQLREQFWERQHRIRQLTILTDKDAVPWELLYPIDPGHDAGFLVEQFPVMRAVFRWRPSRTLNLRPTRFVLPDEPLPQARAEIDALRRLLDPAQPQSEVVPVFTALQDLIERGEFGLLHFACHNRYDQGDGCSIRMGNVRYTPTLMTTAAINKVLTGAAPTIFMNACRSAGFHATYNRLDGWAGKFLEAGAAAFIGTLWAVSDEAAREFAEEFYGQLQKGTSLGEAVMLARHRIAHSHPDDPTWLAYAAYGDPRATVTPALSVHARRMP